MQNLTTNSFSKGKYICETKLGGITVDETVTFKKVQQLHLTLDHPAEPTIPFTVLYVILGTIAIILSLFAIYREFLISESGLWEHLYIA